MQGAEIALFLCNILLIIIIISAFIKLHLLVRHQGRQMQQIEVLLRHDKERFEKEAMSNYQRYASAAIHSERGNHLMTEDKVWQTTPGAIKMVSGGRFNNSVDYLLKSRDQKAGALEETPSPGGDKVEEPAAEQPPSNAVPGVLDVTEEEKAKANANATKDVEFVDNAVPDTSNLPVETASGVIDKPKEGYCGGNTRCSPPFLGNGSFMVSHKNSRGGNSTSKDGFRPNSKHMNML